MSGYEKDPYIQFFNEIDEALGVCSQGARISKGTTSEEGLVYTYFANPFGAPQKRRHHQLARKYMEKMMSNGVKVGQLRTQLGIKGFEVPGLNGCQGPIRVIRGSAMEA